MENINGWTKKLLLGPAEDSWKIHSQNLMCAQMCNNFENEAFTKHQIIFDDIEVPNQKEYTSHLSRTIQPRKYIERKRLYEWSVNMFAKETDGRVVQECDSFNEVKKITTPLKEPSDVPSEDQDPLKQMINSIFDQSNKDDDNDQEDNADTENATDDDDLIDDEAIEDEELETNITGNK